MLVFVEQDRYGTDHDPRRVSTTFAALTMAFPLLYGAAIAVLVYLQGFHVGAVFGAPGDFLDALTLSQALFAGYIGKLMSGLFPTAAGGRRAAAAVGRARGRRAAETGPGDDV